MRRSARPDVCPRSLNRQGGWHASRPVTTFGNPKGLQACRPRVGEYSSRRISIRTGDLLNPGMSGYLGTRTCPVHSAVFASETLAARRAATPRWLGHLVSFGSPAVLSAGAESGSAPSYWHPTSILAPSAAPGAPDAVGARNGGQRVQAPSAVARPNQILLACQWLPIRFSPTVADARIRSGFP